MPFRAHGRSRIHPRVRHITWEGRGSVWSGVLDPAAVVGSRDARRRHALHATIQRPRRGHGRALSRQEGSPRQASQCRIKPVPPLRRWRRQNVRLLRERRMPRICGGIHGSGGASGPARCGGDRRESRDWVFQERAAQRSGQRLLNVQLAKQLPYSGPQTRSIAQLCETGGSNGVVKKAGRCIGERQPGSFPERGAAFRPGAPRARASRTQSAYWRRAPRPPVYSRAICGGRAGIRTGFMGPTSSAGPPVHPQIGGDRHVRIADPAPGGR